MVYNWGMKTRKQICEEKALWTLKQLGVMRKVRGMTQAQMAEWLETTQATISRWESGDATMPLWAVCGYFKALGLNRAEQGGIFTEGKAHE